MNRLLLIFAFISTPPDAAIPHPWPVLPLEVQQAAVQLELVDMRECQNYLDHPDQHDHWLSVFRTRWALYRDTNTPPSRDAFRFPTIAQVEDAMEFNRRYRKLLDFRGPLESHRQFLYFRANAEAEALYQIWDTMHDARDTRYYITTNRQALRTLRELLGDEGYYAGEWPPPVPVWRMNQE
jgi:hypothetical protein